MEGGGKKSGGGGGPVGLSAAGVKAVCLECGENRSGTKTAMLVMTLCAERFLSDLAKASAAKRDGKGADKPVSIADVRACIKAEEKYDFLRELADSDEATLSARTRTGRGGAGGKQKKAKAAPGTQGIPSAVLEAASAQHEDRAADAAPAQKFEEDDDYD